MSQITPGVLIWLVLYKEMFNNLISRKTENFRVCISEKMLNVFCPKYIVDEIEYEKFTQYVVDTQNLTKMVDIILYDNLCHI